eukprot:4439143-Pleurochrysis_carterae.AAC.1
MGLSGLTKRERVREYARWVGTCTVGRYTAECSRARAHAEARVCVSALGGLKGTMRVSGLVRA